MTIKRKEFSFTQNSTSDLEKRVVELERKSHTPCGGSSIKVDLSSLPNLPERKSTTIEQRLTALENKVEELIKLLSQ